ncbi:uncharacterized protein BX663DRAFT_34336 [Cokeromyces recurvatus]|uniref:uncharacterized protein n=1 Tax=Cokeromyces recurvatus TaxID=90255 RepID=UPI00221F7DA5|nr:uncharacterized protein BX663DRAFT_34336 [Cokeromyces recurvatus]KAI7903566.1 hypothetical protein BX663DRAFT_34336 [Cokeromyces recurvatus]
MSTLDSMEDDDDTFYYEVEKIVDMRISETGVHMFLIKWKNYDDAFNTWEPEHNLNCPTILEEFLKGYQKKKTSKTKRKKNSIIKGKKKQHSLPEVEADLQKIVANTKKETAIEKVENKEEKEKDEKEKEEKNKKEKDKKEKDKDEKDKVEKDKVEKDKNEKDVEKDKDKLNENINDTGKGKEKELKRKKSNDDNDDLLEKKRKASTEEVTEQNKRKNVDNPPPKITFTIPSKTKNTSFNTNTSIKLTPKPPSCKII